MNAWPLLPVGIFLSWRLMEWSLHRCWLNRVPLRIHVNGTRGKSQTVTLIANGLQACGTRAAGKVTGVAPTFLGPDGRYVKLRRLGPGSVGEQLSVVRRAARLGVEALVVECNAIEPELQKVSQDVILQAQITAITNVRSDHTDVFGPREEDIACALGTTIPAAGTLVTRDREHLDLFRRMASSRQTECIEAPTPTVRELTTNRELPHWVRRDNLELALSVCEAVGADLPRALEGMLRATPPSTAWLLRQVERHEKRIYFLNAFAANDPQSTEQLIAEAADQLGERLSLLVVFNHRRDRAFRFDSFRHLLADERVEQLLFIGDRVPRWRTHFPKATYLGGKGSARAIVEHIVRTAQPGALVVGMGNIGGAGLALIDLLADVGEEV